MDNAQKTELLLALDVCNWLDQAQAKIDNVVSMPLPLAVEVLVKQMQALCRQARFKADEHADTFRNV